MMKEITKCKGLNKDICKTCGLAIKETLDGTQVRPVITVIDRQNYCSNWIAIDGSRGKVIKQ